MKDDVISQRRDGENQFILRSLEELEKLYGEPHQRSVLKVNDFLDENSRAFIEAAPFAVLATSDRAGNLDCSPRGDRAKHLRKRNQVF